MTPQLDLGKTVEVNFVITKFMTLPIGQRQHLMSLIKDPKGEIKAVGACALLELLVADDKKEELTKYAQQYYEGVSEWLILQNRPELVRRAFLLLDVFDEHLRNLGNPTIELLPIPKK